jgi:putative ABC transport system permease protein
VAAVSRQVLAHPPSDAERYTVFRGDSADSGLGNGLLVGGLAMLEIVLLAGPAFAVGARRRRRDLALVAASGGTPSQVRRIVLADGVVLGTLAAAAGVVLGIGCAAAFRPLIEEHLAHARSGAFQVYPVALAGLAGLAVVTGVLAALVPAWISSRQDVVTALAGRRGITRSRRRWLVLGAVLVTAGVGLAGAGALRADESMILAGLVVGELGLVLCTPALVGLVAQVGRWLPLAPRIALRDTSRNRTAAAPAISAVMAAVVGSVAVGVVLTATNARAEDDYRVSGRPGEVTVYVNVGKGGGAVTPQPVPANAVATLRATMPVEQVHEVSTASCAAESCAVDAQIPPARDCPYSFNVLQREPTAAEQRAARRNPRCDGTQVEHRYFGLFTSTVDTTVVVDETAAGAVAGVAAKDAGRVAAALRSGALVVGDPRLVENGRVTLNITTLVPTGPYTMGPGEVRKVTAPGFVLPQRPRAPITLMTERTARSFGLRPEPLGVMATTSRMPTVAEQDRLEAALGSRFGVYVERGPGSEVDPAALVVLAIVAGVITLGAAAIATGLAAADGRADLTTLAAVGASPRVRRALSLSQAGVVAGLGSLLGVVAGLGASIAVLAALNREYANIWPAPTPYPIAVPWLSVAVALIVVPLIAMLGAGLLTRSRLPIERRL